MSNSKDAFPGYTIETNRTVEGFYIFILVYSFCVFLSIYPLAIWSQKQQQKALLDEKKMEADDGDTEAPSKPEKSQGNAFTTQNRHKNKTIIRSSSFTNRSDKSGTLGAFLKAVDSSYPDRDPDFKSIISFSDLADTDPLTEGQSDIPEGQSDIPSVATTSKINGPKASSKIFDVSGRRWKHRRPIGRVDVIQNAIHSETGSTAPPKKSLGKTQTTRNTMSEVASSVMANENQGFHPDTLMARSSSFGGRRLRHSMASNRSIMSSIVDDISPNDAADALDPGRGNLFVEENFQIQIENNPPAEFKGHETYRNPLLELVTPTNETKQVLRSAFPLSIGATLEAIFRLVTACFISQYLGSKSMIAYLLVGLFVRLTSEELSGAIIDALSSFLQLSVFSGEEKAYHLSGQYIQNALVLQLVLGVPLLALWVFTMKPLVSWFVEDSSIASIAEDYVRVAVFAYLLESLSRTFTVVFHICGHEHFESIIDLTASTVQMVSIACVVALVKNTNLTTIAYIQVLIGFSAGVARIAFPMMKGWDRQFRDGLFKSCAPFQNRIAFVQLIRALFPLLIGAILEYGEWEVLTIFLKHLGPAEVSTWCLLGAFWDVLEAFTEGVGEASATQVALLLSSAQPERAKKLSYSVLYLGFLQSLIVTSLLYMGGRYLAILASTDPVIQNLTNDSFVLMGLANITMSFSQVAWSLVGAQGRFRLATSVMFFSRWVLTIPTALIIIFVFFFSLDSISGCLIIGYSTASCALTFILLSSDWERLARLMHEMNSVPKTELDFEFDDDDDSSSDGFGFMEQEIEEASGELRKRF